MAHGSAHPPEQARFEVVAGINPLDGLTLVLGDTGEIGRRVVERLTARGLPVRIGSRSGEPRFHWRDRSTWGPVPEGVGSAYVCHYWDTSPGAAQTLGLARQVLLSGE